MGDIEVAETGAVADVRPGDLADQSKVEPLRGGEALLGSGHERGAIDERNEPGNDGRGIAPLRQRLRTRRIACQ